MKRLILAVAAFAAACPAFAQEQACTIADFTGRHGWGNPHHVANVGSSEKGLSFEIDGEDPWFFGPTVEIPAVPAEPRRMAFTMACAPTLVHAAGEVEVIAPEKGTLRCRITAWPQTPSKVVVTRVAKPQRVFFAGASAKFEYIPERRAIVVEIPANARGVLEVVVSD